MNQEEMERCPKCDECGDYMDDHSNMDGTGYLVFNCYDCSCDWIVNYSTVFDDEKIIKSKHKDTKK